MPREIADSDAESDLNSPHRPSASPIPENTVEPPPLSTLEQDPFANIEFDQFLSPTQRLSSAVERQDVSQSHSISSTDRFLRDIIQSEEGIFSSTATTHGLDGTIEHSSSAMPRNTSKRTLSDIEGAYSKSHADEEIRQGSVKRAKTYGNSKMPKSDTSTLFSNTVDPVYHQQQDTTRVGICPHSESTSTGIPVQQLMNPESAAGSSRLQENRAVGHAQSHLQQGATSFVQGNIQNTSMTRSSMSGYTGINMDFRGAGLGLDTGANPFGSLSQVSLDADVDPVQTEKFASLFQHSQQSMDDPIPMSNAFATLIPSPRNEMATSPVEAPRENHQHDSPEENLDVKTTKDSEVVVNSKVNYEIRSNDVEGSDHANSTRKKRGRKPKAIQSRVDGSTFDTNVFQQLQAEDPLEIPPEQYHPRPSRSRAGTVDSVVSHTSQASGATEKSNRRRKETAVDRKEINSGKHLSSELNLSDPAMIGAPKEMYVPRPSKSRSRRAVPDEDELQQDEQYQADRNATPAPPQSLTKDVDVTQSTSVKKKAGKKSKVKRAKTSAAALLKSAEMYDEDDMDCIIVDEVPSKVRMAPLPEISRIKPEPPQVDGHEEGMEERTAEVKITVDIPKLDKPGNTEPVEPTSKPKKRGRKPKPKAELHIEAEPSEDLAKAQSPGNNEEKAYDGRSPLSEKDPNTTATSNAPSTDQTNPSKPSTTPPSELDPEVKSQSQTSSPKKPVHSPLKPRPKLTSTASTPTSASSTSSLWSKPRVGLSRRTTIPSLLRKLDRSKEPPKVVERKEKLSKRQQEEEAKRRLEAEDAGEDYVDRWAVRGKDGMLVEWDE